MDGLGIYVMLWAKARGLETEFLILSIIGLIICVVVVLKIDFHQPPKNFCKSCKYCKCNTELNKVLSCTLYTPKVFTKSKKNCPVDTCVKQFNKTA